MEVPVTCHGNFLYSVLVNVTPMEHESILKYKWYKLKGQPVAPLQSCFKFEKAWGESFSRSNSHRKFIHTPFIPPSWAHMV